MVGNLRQVELINVSEIKNKIMTTKKLFEILTLVDGLISNKWQTVMDIVDCINKDKVEIVEKKWCDSWGYKEKNPKYYPLNLEVLGTWSTYDDTCIDLRFNNKNNKLHCDVKIYEGDSFRGHRKDARFSAKLILPNKFIKKLETRLNWKLDDFIEDRYDEHLELQRKLWMTNLKNEILNK